MLKAQGIDKRYVELEKDYGLRSEGKSPYSITCRDTKSNQYIMLVSGLPHVDAFGDKINPSLFNWEGKYYSNSADNFYNNLFWLEVGGTQVTAMAVNDQPTGELFGEKVVWNPQLFLDGVEQYPTSQNAVLLPVDPANSNYSYNTLEWDYGICIRRIRAIEGQLLERWVFDGNPIGEVRVQHNHTGTYPLRLGSYAVDDDTELVPASTFDEAEYPFRVAATATFYPDADPESTSVDGSIRHFTEDTTWANIRDGVGTETWDTSVDFQSAYILSGLNTDEWQGIIRSVYLFDTSGLPDGADISATTLSFYGTLAYYNPWDLTLNIYSSAPASNTALVAGDYDSLGTTAYCDTGIAASSWNASGYNDFPFNATGIAAIDKTGVSKFGARDATYDVANSPPTWVGDSTSSIKNYFADQGSGYEPKLVVTYTLPVDPPTVTTQAATSVEETTATGNGNITDTGGENCDERGFDYDIDSGEPYAYSATDTGDFGTGTFTKALTSLNAGTTYYIRAKAHNSGGWGYGGEEIFYTKPEDPTALTDTGRTNSSISLSWTKGTGSEKTMIRYRTDQYPTSVSDGTQAYYDTGSSTTVSTLPPAQIYYFRAWAWDTNSGYSDGTNDDTAYTAPGDPSALTATTASDIQIDLSWTKGTGGDKTMVRRNTGSYPTGPANGDQVYFDTGTAHNDVGRSPSTEYFYRAWAYDSDSGYYSDSYSEAMEQMPPLGAWSGTRILVPPTPMTGTRLAVLGLGLTPTI